MIPVLVPRRQLLAANGIFTLTLNAAFALGFALLGPLVVNVAGPEAVILVVAALYFLAAVFCFTLPPAPPPQAEKRAASRPRRRGGRARGRDRRSPSCARASAFIRANRAIAWSLIYLGDRRIAGRRARRARPGLRQGDARARGQGLRGRRPAARVRDRDRDPAAQLLRPLLHPPPDHRRRADRARHPARGAVRGRPDQPLPAAGRRTGRGRPVGRDLAARGRRRHRLLRRHRLRPRRDPVADPAPGGPARGRPRPRVRRPEHARVGRELPADHHRRPDLGPGRHDRGHLRDGDRRAGHRDRVGADPRPGPEADGRPTGGGPDAGRPDRGGARRRPADVDRPRARSGRRRRSRRRPRRCPTPPTSPEPADGARRGRVHRRHDQHGLRPGRRRQRADARRRGDPRPDARRSTRSPRSWRSTGDGRRRATSRSRTCSRSATCCASRWPIRRSTARSSSRAPTRSRRPRSAGISSSTERSRSS